MRTETFVVHGRFCGPPSSANGGYICGRIAKNLPGAVSVRLKAPPPLGVELRVETADEEARLYHESAVIGEARRTTLDLAPPVPPSYAEAEQASKSYIGFANHAFPRCFVCGPQRARGDGLRIFPGSLAARALVAAPWIPDGSLAGDSQTVDPVFIWSALDCSGGFSVLPVPDNKAILLGELLARIDGVVTAGEKCVVVGWSLGVEGRKRLAGSAVYSEAGKPVAVARATWIEVPRAAFSGV